MSNHRTHRSPRRTMSLASDSIRADRARSAAHATLASAGSLSLLDLYIFAQDAVHHMVVTICPTATHLRHLIVDRVLDRLAGRLRRQHEAALQAGPDGSPTAGQQAGREHGLQFATVPAMEAYLKQTIGTNLIDARRASKLRAEAAPMIDEHGVATPLVDVVPDPHATAPGADMIDPVHHALLVRALKYGIDLLSTDGRQALSLSLKGRTAPQIGTIMGRTPESVRQLLSRGTRSLRTIVTAELESAGIPITDINAAHLHCLAELTAKRLAA
jgi:DNA-directed RNA polymerase specialized sigma24 family protein